MPIYEYKCQKCNHEFEKLVRPGDTPECPTCHSSDLERLVSTPGISTERLRKRNFNLARRAHGKVKKEKDHAQAEYERNYIKDHS